MEWTSFFIGLGTAILLGWIWERTPLRLKVYKLSDRVDVAGAVGRFRFYTRVMPRYGDVLRVIVDFLIFWFIFEWNQGIIKNYILEKGLVIVTWLTDKIYFLSPFGRKAAQDERFRYCLIIYTICVVIELVIYFWVLYETCFFWESLFVATIISGIVWYACFGLCFLLVLIPIWFKLLSAVLAVVSSILITIMIVAIWNS